MLHEIRENVHHVLFAQPIPSLVSYPEDRRNLLFNPLVDGAPIYSPRTLLPDQLRPLSIFAILRFR